MQAGGAGDSLDIISLIVHAGPVPKAVLALLALMSVVSWYVIGAKWMYLARAHRRSLNFVERFWNSSLDEMWKEAQTAAPSPVSEVFRAGYQELVKLRKRHAQAQQQAQAGVKAEESGLGDIESLERALARARTMAVTEMENKVPFLATTASAAPFIGLFGTVWGIMNSFRNIGAKGAANLATVAPGIAEALVATAIGLVAAIPAVMGYNYLSRRIRVISAEMETFTNDFLN
ncbi:MAG: MotA/TolQ/ExbB proton channel family protein, partial [Deltaproteobacteria bacterium]|nr:MotA/TolQ/ExbB proton channel family protein [Deltaproteobacteria bacterium]